jgi:hypothetical protein
MPEPQEARSMLVVDAHLDLAMNAVMWNRDLARSAHGIRRIEREEGLSRRLARCVGERYRAEASVVMSIRA